jgi:uncharacterized membrane protein
MGISSRGSSDGFPGKGRIETLSDGIFAIAMTLIVLNIRVPSLPKDIAQVTLETQVIVLWPKFLIYVLSFVILAIFWVSHSIQFNYIRRANRILFWINILFLMFVAFIPFSANLLSEHIKQQFAVGFYSCHLMLAWACLCLQWLYATGKQRLVDSDIDPSVVSSITKRIVLAPAAYLLAICVSFFSTSISIAICGSIVVLYIIPGRIDRYWINGKR